METSRVGKWHESIRVHGIAEGSPLSSGSFPALSVGRDSRIECEATLEVGAEHDCAPN